MPKPNKVARKLAGKAIKTVAKRVTSGTLEAGAAVIRAAADHAADAGHKAVETTANKRLPIQRHVDIAVPLAVAWEEWLEFEAIPEGVHTITNIERNGAELTGVTSGPRRTSWAAEILDQREQESFAWQSYEATDCAGLVTFHALSERLTRIELNLDVVPTGVSETMQLATHLADRKADAELRRLKARLEVISPDLYEEITPASEGDASRGDEDEEEPQDDPGEEEAA